MKKLILAGAGHAHLVTMDKLARIVDPDLEVTLISPTPWQHYSGMLPGWVAGEYSGDECRIDIRPIARKAGIRFIMQKITAIDADANTVRTADGEILHYDILSLDTGSETENGWYQGMPGNILTAKPLDAFQNGWSKAMEQAQAAGRFNLVVVGGGAAGVELAMVGKSALNTATENNSVTLVISESGLLPGHGETVKARVKDALKRAGIIIRNGRATGLDESLTLSSGETLKADHVIAATGAKAASWLASSGLSRDPDGFVLTDANLRSISHQNVFAVGDVSSRVDVNLPRSGVHAVRAGPILAHNILADSDKLQSYIPRRHSLYILATGPKTAIASWGRWSAEGRWVWYWKDFIDRRFMRRFKRINT